MFARLGEVNAGNKRAPSNVGWGIEAVLEADRKALERMSRPKHRKTFRKYSMNVWKYYALNQWRFFIKPRIKRNMLEVAVMFETRFTKQK